MIDQKDLSRLFLNVAEKDYREDPSLSYSLISRFKQLGFEGLDKVNEPISSDSLTFGAMVDCLLTDKDNFDKRFYVLNDSECIPTDLMKGIVNVMMDKYPDKGFMDLKDDEILVELDNMAYQTNWKADTRVKSFKDKCGSYYSNMVLARGKSIVTKDAYDTAILARDSVEDSVYGKYYFNEPENDNYRNYYQLKFKTVIDDIPLKGMMDVVHVDYLNKTIRIVDLKTSYKPEYKFYESFMSWNYAWQANIYTTGLQSIIAEDDFFKHFTILPFQFLVVSGSTLIPLIWEWKLYDKPSFEIGDYKLDSWKEYAINYMYYKEQQSIVPKGININEPNQIDEFIIKNK